jgi:hypothetical protein
VAPPDLTPKPMPAVTRAELDRNVDAAIASQRPEAIAAAVQNRADKLAAWDTSDQARRQALESAYQTHVQQVALEERKAQIARDAATQLNQNEIAKANAAAEVARQAAAQAAEVESRKSVLGSQLATAADASKESTKAATSARGTLTYLQRMEAVEPSLGEGAFPLQSHYPEFAAIMNAANIGTKEQNDALGGAQQFQGLTSGLALQAKPAGLNRLSNMDIGLLLNQNPTLLQTHDGRMLVMGGIKKYAQQTLAEDQVTQDYIGHNNAIVGKPGEPSLSEVLTDRFAKQPLFEKPPPIPKTADPATRQQLYQSYLNDPNRPMGTPFYVISPKSGQLTLGYRDPGTGGALRTPLDR